MEWNQILSHVDHTLLKPQARWQDIQNLVDEAVAYGCASVCIPPSCVKQAAEYAAGRVPICTVIGFPNGYNTTAVKCFEAANACFLGASEIDMVVNLGWVKDGLYDQVGSEISQLKATCGDRILKVIVETCLLTQEEKIRLCQVVSESGADYIKTSTGFSTGGATREDVALLRQYTAPSVKVKAAGGIASKEDAEAFFGPGGRPFGHQPSGGPGKGGGAVMEQKEAIRLALVERAKEARKSAYCPYSGFAVGAALLCADGSVYAGCNIENAGFTATCCAERTAFFRAVNDGKRAFKAIAIVGGKAGQEPQELCAPCGVCRQVMAEFCALGLRSC